MKTNFRNLFKDIYISTNSRSNAKEPNLLKQGLVREDGMLNFLPSGPQEEYFIQHQIRPIFGKTGINKTPIGTHPDFIELEGAYGVTKSQYICTLFLDIKGSTKLSLLYPLEDVYQFKNAVIKSCIETVRSLDGHVHRIMGDSVMAFFGGKDVDKENAIADAMNCIVTLRAILEESIKPWMRENGFENNHFGFRIGCEFGDDHEVLWGGFGYQNVGEISVTGFPVDMASKLQGLAGKNEAMLGQRLLDFVDWPDKYLEVKEIVKEGNTELLPTVIPNLTNSNDQPINYKMRQLLYKKSLRFSALPIKFRKQISGSQVVDHAAIEYKCFAIKNNISSEYISASKFLSKNVSLVFKVRSATTHSLFFPLKAVFTKTNHGIETPADERGIEQEGRVRFIYNRSTNIYHRAPPIFVKAELEEITSYRGLHTMKCEVFDAEKKLLFRDWIGVLIK